MIEPTALLIVIAFAMALRAEAILAAIGVLLVGGVIIWGMRR